MPGLVRSLKAWSTFEQLYTAQNGSDVIIGDVSTGKALAVLMGVDASALSAEAFIDLSNT